MGEPYQEPTDKDFMAAHIEALEREVASLEDALEGCTSGYISEVSARKQEIEERAQLEQQVERLEEALGNVINGNYEIFFTIRG